MLKTPTLYALRRYAVAYLRPTGALPLLRVGKQPYGILPVVGKRFVEPSGSAVETAHRQGARRAASDVGARERATVPTLTTATSTTRRTSCRPAPWSQTAYYRDKDAGKAMCMTRRRSAKRRVEPAAHPGRQSVLAALGVAQTTWHVHIDNCNDFLPDPPYSAGYLAGVPWVLADAKDPKNEAPTTRPSRRRQQLPRGRSPTASIQTPDARAQGALTRTAGPALLQALARLLGAEGAGRRRRRSSVPSGAVRWCHALSDADDAVRRSARYENEAMFTVADAEGAGERRDPGGDRSRDARASTSRARCSVAATCRRGKAAHMAAADSLIDSRRTHAAPQTRDLGAVKLSLDYLSTRTVGELNIAFRITLDAFSYRLDAWISARANRRLEQMRATEPTGVYVGGYAWVENLKADRRPDSEGYLLAPSQSVRPRPRRSCAAASWRITSTGAFDITLDSKRTRARRASCRA